jgi:hypothetical protein
VALTPLTRVQQATVLVLVEARRLDVVPADVARGQRICDTPASDCPGVAVAG